MSDVLYERGNVTVTPTRLVVGGKTYPIAGITSVEVKPANNLMLPLILAVVLGAVIGGGAGLAVGAAVLFGGLHLTRGHVVHLNTAGNDIAAYETKDRGTALDIAEAIGEAVDLRG